MLGYVRPAAAGNRMLYVLPAITTASVLSVQMRQSDVAAVVVAELQAPSPYSSEL